MSKSFISSHKWITRAIIVIALLVGLFGASLTSMAQQNGPVPNVQCVAPLGNGQYVAQFGYQHATKGEVIPVGELNRFDPAPEDRGQPTTFSNGNVTNAVSVAFDGTPLTWHLNGNPAQASAASEPCASTGPIANGDSYSTGFNTVLNVAAPGVLDNDFTSGGGALTASLVANATNGTVTLAADGSFTYTPNATFSGVDSFTYTASDGTTSSNIADVLITVANAIPVANDDSYNTAFNTAINEAAPGIIANDTDANGDTLTAFVVSTPANAANFTLNGDGSFDFTPNPTFSGTTSFTYYVNDGKNNSNTATVTITVENALPVANDDSYNTAFNTAINQPAPGVLGNDTDGNNEPLTATLIGVPSHAIGFILNADGSFSYTPEAAFSGTDSFTYSISDGKATSNTATVTITVANAIPTAANDSYNVAFGGSISEAAPGVLGNDTDGNGDALTAVLVSGPAHATSFTLNADGSFSYTPEAAFSGSDSFTYNATDGTDNSAPATVTLAVGNPAPTASADSYSGPFNTAVSISAPGVLGNDSDPNGDSLTAALVSGPSHAASFTLDADGSFVYTPNASFSGTDSFTYSAFDGASNSAPATVSITIANAAPVANNDSFNTSFAGTFNQPAPGVLANDTDANGNALTAILVSGPSHATSFTLNANGSFSYTPQAMYTGTDSFTYRANDGTANSNVATVQIGVGVPAPLSRINPADNDMETTGVVKLLWGHDPAAEWYQVIIVNANSETIINEWLKAADICDASSHICDGGVRFLKDHSYGWWMRTWSKANGMSAWGSTSFSVDGNVPGQIARIAPANGETFTTAPDGTVLTWQADPQAAWYHVQLLLPDGTRKYNKWFKVTDVCANGTCFISELWLPNNTYTWNMRAWSPEGMGAFNTTTFTINVPQPGSITQTSLAEGSTVSSGEITLTWQENTSISWYRVVIGGGVYDKWYRGSTVCNSGTCSVTLTLSAGSYKWWMYGWGPAGNPQWTVVAFTAQ